MKLNDYEKRKQMNIGTHQTVPGSQGNKNSEIF